MHSTLRENKMQDIKVSKQMIDEVFDFIEGRRVKKESGAKMIVLRGVRGAKFPQSLLRGQDEVSPLSRYMDGIKQVDIAAEFDLPTDNATYRRLGVRYAKKLELFWTYTAVMEFISPVLDIKIESVFPTEGEGEAVLLKCYQLGVTTVKDFLNLFVRYEVRTVRVFFLKCGTVIFDTIFKKIRRNCYSLL